MIQNYIDIHEYLVRQIVQLLLDEQLGMKLDCEKVRSLELHSELDLKECNRPGEKN